MKTTTVMIVRVDSRKNHVSLISGIAIVDETQISNEDADALEEGVAYVQSVVGDVPIPALEIKEALWYYYFDREETVNWVMGMSDI